jgi:sugar-specific transcriptional regulator TrmB
MSNSRVNEYLKQVGLTSYESEAYLALLSSSTMTAEEISEKTSIPITRVYDTLEQLMQKGFAKIIQGRPKRFHALSPEQAKREYMNHLRQGFETELRTVDETLRHLQRQVEPLYVESHLQVKAEELLEPLSDLRSMEKKTIDYVKQAEDEVLVSTALFSWLPKIKPALREAAHRGARVRVLMQVHESQVGNSLGELAKLGVQIRESPDPWHPVRGTLIDSKDLVFVIWAAEEAERHWNPIVYTPNHTKNPGLIRIFRESFLFRWANSSTHLPRRVLSK